MSVLDELTDDVLANLGFVRDTTTKYDCHYGQLQGQVYWREQRLRVVVREAPPGSRTYLMQLEGFNPVAVAAGHQLPLWTQTFTQETPMPLVMAALRRASDYMTIMYPKEPRS